MLTKQSYLFILWWVTPPIGFFASRVKQLQHNEKKYYKDMSLVVEVYLTNFKGLNDPINIKIVNIFSDDWHI